MKQIYLKRFFPHFMMLSLLISVSCTDIWKEHYNEESFILSDKTITECIQENSQLSTFYNMLKITGYDKILNSSQSYTVWAPTNDALAGIDTTNKSSVLNIVENHIARSRHTTSGIETQAVLMIDGKYIFFNRTDSGFSFGNNTIVDPNLPASNGLVHIIDGYAPYLNNLWEYIGTAERLDSLKKYLYGAVQNEFDPENSIEIGVDTTGAAIYDSVFILSNPVLKKIGQIDSEDSVFTGIFPDNDAWSEAYGRIEGFFNFPLDAGSVKRQRAMTQYTLVKDMLFRGWLMQPETLDSLVSSTGNVYHNPGLIFSGTEGTYLSNGISHITSQMPYVDTVSWFNELKVEAEDEEGREKSSSTIYPKSGYGSGMNVSNNKYIYVDPGSSTSPSVTFSIPNTLSAKYNIYCVFVPAKIADPTDYTPTRVKFKLTYISRGTGSVFTESIIPTNNITSPTGLTKMLVSQFDFEYANIVDEDYKRVAVQLEVINDVTVEEESAHEYSRKMRIDCIIFEPVTE